jgi:CheY-like chemotaxis protein
MPARIVVVHDEPGLAEEVASALNLAGHQVDVFIDPLAAWDALAAARLTDVLITRVQFPPGMSNGLALARMARSNRPGIQVIFAALPEFAIDCEGEGVFLPLPVPAPQVVKIVKRILQRLANSNVTFAGASSDLSGDGNGQSPRPCGRIVPSIGLGVFPNHHFFESMRVRQQGAGHADGNDGRGLVNHAQGVRRGTVGARSARPERP